MSIVLFAIIGANINASSAYWICFAVYCVIWFTKLTIKLLNEN